MAPMSERPNPARMYDYFLGGQHNFEIDREAANQIIALYPASRAAAQTNRAFLGRVVRFLSAQGIEQFLDIGSGIPTMGNVHEIAQELNPRAHVVYVDIDPVAVILSQTILRENNAVQVATIEGNVCMPEAILANPEVQRLINLNQPLAILMVALLHFVTDDALAQRVVQTLRAAMPPGSYLVISHVSHEGLPPEIRAKGEAVYARSTNPSVMRSRGQIEAFFAGLDLVEPGVVWVPQWQPEREDDLFVSTPTQSLFLAGVGHKP